MIHYLKIELRWLNRISANEKHCEVRLDDRDYQAGDTVVLHSTEYGSVRRKITHVLRSVDGNPPGLHPSYVVLSLEDPRVTELPGLEREVERLTRSNRSLRARARKLTGSGK